MGRVLKEVFFEGGIVAFVEIRHGVLERYCPGRWVHQVGGDQGVFDFCYAFFQGHNFYNLQKYL